MKKVKITCRLTSMLLALLMFLTSTSMSLDIHYCQGEIKSFSFFGKAKSCYQLNDVSSNQLCTHVEIESVINNQSDCSVKRKNCCHNEVKQFKSNQIQTIDFKVSEKENNQDFLDFSFADSNLTYPSKSNAENNIALYNGPPIIQRDIYVLFESFLL